MRFSKSWLYGGLVAAAGLGMIALVGTPRIRRGMKVLLIGDSMAVGMTPHFQALSKEMGIQFKSLALVGTRIDQWAQSANLKSTLASFRPELVLISLGTSDEYMPADAVARQKASIEQLLALVQSVNPEAIVWLGPPTLPKKTNGIAAMIQDARGNPVTPKFMYFHSEKLSLPRGPDGIHPTALGYAGWAGAIWNWLS